MDIYDTASQVKSQHDFVNFLKILIKDFEDQSNDGWDNDTLETFLEGLYGYLLDENIGDPMWDKFANALLAARVYE